MEIYQWVLLTGFLIFIISFFSIFINVLFIKRKNNYSKAQGKIIPGILYSFTSAMSPARKESAFLHLPTYISGMIFHIGTFLSFFWLIVCFFNIHSSLLFRYIIGSIVLISSICGVSILIKRLVKLKLRKLSHPEDYFSNLFVTGFQVITIISLVNVNILPALYIYSTLLFLYIPVGKLKHTIYFFISRINLGIYYGKRKVWPAKK